MWVDEVLDGKWTWLTARMALVGIFVVSGLMKLLNFADAVVEHESLGLHPGALWASLIANMEGHEPQQIS